MSLGLGGVVVRAVVPVPSWLGGLYTYVCSTVMYSYVSFIISYQYMHRQ